MPPKKYNLTYQQCQQLQQNPNKNPITGRKLNPEILNGIYERMKQECDQLMKEFVGESKDVIPEEIKELYKKRLRRVLKKALKPILNPKDRLEDRIQYAKIIREYVNTVQPCIQTSNAELVLLNRKKHAMDEKIVFNKQIGSESVYGTAYLNTGKGFGRLLKFSIKVMKNTFKKEVDLLRQMSKLAEEGITPNMPITYATFNCRKKIPLEESGQIAIPELIKKGNYYVVINELANGDMHDWFKYTHFRKDYESMILQMLFSLRTFHKYTGYMHNDAHLGNFLWHTITPGGYWHYFCKEFNMHVYVPNTGYLAVLWDPGLAKEISPRKVPNMDYHRVLALLRGIAHIEDYKLKKMYAIPKDTFAPFAELLGYIDQYYYNAPKDIAMEFLSIVRESPFKFIFFDKSHIPKNEKIINTTPYLI